MFGDGDYTAREAVVDAAGGAIGGSLAKPLLRGAGQTAKFVGTSVRHRAFYSTTTAHAKDVALAGSTLMARNILTRPVLKGQVKGSVFAHSAGYVYDYFRQSSGSSSESYQQNGGPGGTVKPMLSDASINWNLRNGYSMAATTEHACGTGYRLKKVKGKWMCVPFNKKWQKKYA